jgi:uncharacterized Zn finger protein (UPF0148 family)
MKDLECPNCGGSSPKVINEGEFRCVFCDTLYYNEAMQQRKRAADKQAARIKTEESRQQVHVEQARTVNNMSKRILLFVSIVLLIVFGFVGYMAKQSMDQSAKSQEQLIKSLQSH